MSTPLQGAACLRRDGRTAWIRVDCEVGGFDLPLSNVFALALVEEPLRHHVFSEPGVPWPREVRGPLAAALCAAGLDQHGLEVLMSGTLPDGAERAARFVRALGYRDIRNVRLPPSLRPDGDGLYRPHAWWTTDAERLAECERMDDEAEALYEADAPALASGTLVVEATDAVWLQHLEAGMSWDSFAFDEAAPSIPRTNEARRTR